MVISTRVSKEIITSQPQTTRRSTIFQLFFLKDDTNQSVEVMEVEKVDFGEVIQHLNQGESAFITRKRARTGKPSLKIKEETEEPSYFTHF